MAFLFIRLAAVLNIQQLAVGADPEPEADFELIFPAGGRKFALLEQLLIVRGKSLQDHVNTSTFRQSSTPWTSLARKNWERMFFGSE